jgi:hypothetical protein
MSEHVMLVAFSVTGATRKEAHGRLLPMLPRPNDDAGLDCWWVAEDDRNDGSDNDSAVFVHPGTQVVASRLLNLAGLTGDCNLVERDDDWDALTEHEDRVPATETPERMAQMVDHLRGLPTSDLAEIAWSLVRVMADRDGLWAQ